MITLRLNDLKLSPLLKFYILGVFVNTFTADDKHPLWDCENLPCPIERQLSWKRKPFSQFFVPFIESSSNFKHFQKEKIVVANVLPKLESGKDFFRALSENRCLRTSFESQQVKGSQILVKVAWEHFYRIFSSLWQEMTWKVSPFLKF